MILFLILLALSISISLNYYLCHPQAALAWLDEPNHRSLHTQATPRTGGIGLLGGFIVAVLIACWSYSGLSPAMQQSAWLCWSALLVMLISGWDDYRHVPILLRLGVHGLAASLLLWQGQYGLTELLMPGLIVPLPFVLQIALSMLFIMWMVNLYNFMDGMDGLAGGMAIFGFGTLALLGGMADNTLFMLMNVLLVSAVAGFLWFNFPPAKIFMGDTGASSLGFLAAGFSLWGQQAGIFPLWVAILIFSPFIVDATLTLCKRLWRREKVWQAHKTHYYQRLVQLGWGHKRTVLWAYGLMLGCSLSALLAMSLPILGQWLLLAGWLGIYIGIVVWVRRLEQQKNLTMQPDTVDAHPTK